MKRLINLCLFDRKHIFLLEIESMNRILFFLALCPTILIAQVDITHTGGDWGESGQSSATFTANQTSCTIQTGPQTFSYVVSKMLRRFAHVDRFSWAQQAFNAKIPAPVEDARILKVARRGFPHPLISLGFRRFRAIDVPDDVPFNRCCKPMV